MRHTLATHPCASCGQPVATVTDCGGHTRELDTTAPVYVRLRDGDGGALWALDDSREILVAHKAVCRGKP